ncbi:MAG: acyl-CoA dehydrogenase family protein [Chitinophagales bacterium]|nr:acyl-CoA dehydrogenase family protein [Chitinophagales bacterium]MDW8418632.1 acyl-CoA dehydrogenase family protein [Chitinophagales bacterium]
MQPYSTPYTSFIQTIPQLNNEYECDIFLRDYLKVYLPEEVLNEIEEDLYNFGNRVVEELPTWARDAEVNKPCLTHYDAWGNRIDEIKVSEGWKKLERVAAEEGLVAIGYERKYRQHSRLYQFVKLYLYTASSAIYTCPLAMTDGAARLIEVHGDDYLHREVYPRLTDRDPRRFITSGQWMTERTGGSDVSRSMTIAIEERGEYRLYGHKWFTSAITADVAFTLASTEQPAPGERARLSLFYLPIRNKEGKLNNIEVEALKDKLGTRALPTAQLRLCGARARMVGQKGKGVKTISTLFNITRIYNTISAVSYMRRAYALSAAYAGVREAFGKTITSHPLHRQTIRTMEIAYQSNALLAFLLARLLGREECKTATENEKALLRFLTPVAKLYTARQAIRYASEHIESFGGIGYLEDSGIPVMLRDVQVLSIWEGTTNVLALDMLRAAQKENGMEAFRQYVYHQLSQSASEPMYLYKEKIRQKADALFAFLDKKRDVQEAEKYARDLAFYIAELTIALQWLEFIERLQNPRATYMAALNYWLKTTLNEQLLDTADDIA